MNDLIKASFSIEWNTLKEFDKVIEKKGYNSRSKAIRDIIEDYVLNEKIKQKYSHSKEVKEGLFIIGLISNKPISVKGAYSFDFPLDENLSLSLIILKDYSSEDAEQILNNIKREYTVHYCKIIQLERYCSRNFSY